MVMTTAAARIKTRIGVPNRSHGDGLWAVAAAGEVGAAFDEEAGLEFGVGVGLDMAILYSVIFWDGKPEQSTWRTSPSAESFF